MNDCSVVSGYCICLCMITTLLVSSSLLCKCFDTQSIGKVYWKVRSRFSSIAYSHLLIFKIELPVACCKRFLHKASKWQAFGFNFMCLKARARQILWPNFFPSEELHFSEIETYHRDALILMKVQWKTSRFPSETHLVSCHLTELLRSSAVPPDGLIESQEPGSSEAPRLLCSMLGRLTGRQKPRCKGNPIF